MIEKIEPPPGFEPGTYGLRNAELCKESQPLNCGADRSADTSENELPIRFAKPIEHVLFVAPEDKFYHLTGARCATSSDLEAAGYISLAEHVRVVDELLNRHEASNG